MCGRFSVTPRCLLILGPPPWRQALMLLVDLGATPWRLASRVIRYSPVSAKSSQGSLGTHDAATDGGATVHVTFIMRVKFNCEPRARSVHWPDYRSPLAADVDMIKTAESRKTIFNNRFYTAVVLCYSFESTASYPHPWINYENSERMIARAASTLPRMRYYRMEIPVPGRTRTSF